MNLKKINIKINKTEHIITNVFLVMGLISLAIFLATIIYSFINPRIAVEVEVVDVRDTDVDDGITTRIYVEYHLKKKYISKLSSYTNNYTEGKKFTAYYEKNNPKKIYTTKYNFVVLGICAFASFVFLRISMGKIISKKIIDNQNSKIKSTGILINARIIECVYNKMFEVNGKSPFNIICEWYDEATNKSYMFKSENIWIDPNKIIQVKNIKELPVYVNPDNIEEYYMDLTQLEIYTSKKI